MSQQPVRTPPTASSGRAAVIAAVLERARTGAGTLLVGPPGAGRTRLLADLGAELHRGGTRTAAVTATASASTVPFGALLPLVTGATAQALAAADPLGRAALLRVAVLELDLGAVLVDEAPLLDPGSAAFLLELAQSGVAVVATATSGRPVPDAIRALEAQRLAAAVAVPPLTPAETGAIAEDVLGGPIDAAARRELHRTCAGNPGLLHGLLRDALADGAVRRVGAVWVLAGALRAPRSLQQATERRLRRLEPAVVAWIAAVAIAEHVPIDAAELLVPDEIADRADREGWTVFDPSARVTRMRQRAVQAAVADALGARERRTTLRALLKAFEALDRRRSDVETAAAGAWRLELGGPLPPEEATRLGHLVSLSAPTLSERFHRAAVDAGGGTAAEVALAEQLKRTGRIGEAQALLGAAAPDDAETADRVAAMLAIVTGFAARRSGPATAMLEARAAEGREGPDAAAVRAGLLLRERRLDEGLTLARRVGLPRRPDFAAVFAGINEVLLLTALGRTREALGVVEHLREPALHTVERIPEGPVTADWLSGWAPWSASLQLAPAEAVAVRNYDRMIETGMHAARPQFGALLGLVATAKGDPVTGARLLQEAEASPGIWRDSWLSRLTGWLAEALAQAGDLPAAAAAIDRLRAMHRPADHEAALPMAVAHLHAARGDAAGAAALAAEVARRAAGQGAVVEAFDAEAAALRWGDADAAARLLVLPAPEGEVRELQRAHARAVRDDDPDGIDAVAVALWAAGHRALAIAAALDALRRRPAPAVRAAERLSTWLVQTPALAVPRPRVPSGADLTRREREVAALAATGLSDRAVADELGISLRTAQTHLGRVYGKLGVHRRQELVALLGAD